jgi:putative ABC transport system permease protein
VHLPLGGKTGRRRKTRLFIAAAAALELAGAVLAFCAGPWTIAGVLAGCGALAVAFAFSRRDFALAAQNAAARDEFAAAASAGAHAVRELERLRSALDASQIRLTVLDERAKACYTIFSFRFRSVARGSAEDFVGRLVAGIDVFRSDGVEQPYHARSSRLPPLTALFRALVLGHIRGNPLRTAVTVFAVALGVAIALAIDLANTTAVASFASSVNVISSHVNLQVLGVGRGFADQTLLRVSAVPGVTYAGPSIEDSIVVGAKAGDAFSGEVLRVLGIDLLRPLPGDSAAAFGSPGMSAGGAEAPDPDLLVNGHGAFISERVARKYGWSRGSVLHGLAGDRSVSLHVASVIPASVPGVDSSVVFVDIATAQEIFEKLGRLDRIDLIVDQARIGAITKALAEVIPPGTRVIAPAVRTGEIRRMLSSFQLNLAALSYIALLVGMYLIYNTVAISVVARRPEIGTLRALGATKRGIFGAFVAEGALFGLTGSAAGLVLGGVLAQLSVGAVSRTVDTLYVASHADHVIFAPLVLLKAFVVGVVLSMLSAFVPALEAAATPPAVAMRSAGYERRPKGLATRLALAGAVLFVLAYVCTLFPAVDDIPLFGYAAGLLIIFAGSLFTPLAIGAVSRAGVAALGRRSAAGQLAAANLGASPMRNSVAVASLMIAIAMMVSIAILIGSFRTTVVAWADDTLKADLFVRPLGLQDASYDSRFSPSVAKTIARIPGVAAVDAFRGISIPFRGRITTLGATDFSTIAERNKLRFIGVTDTRALARTLPGTDRVLVSDPFATKFHLGRGDSFRLDTPGGTATFTIAAIYSDYSSDAGIVLMDARTFIRLYHDDSVNSIAIYAQPGADLARLRSDVVRSVLPLRVEAQTTRELRKLVLTIFNRTFAITYALYVISITIAVLGVVSTLFALVLERRREIGLMRYLGLRRHDVRMMVYYEAALIGMLGGVMGVIVGVLLSLLLIFVINRQAFGWLIELTMPWDFLLEAIGLVVVAAVVAGVYPAGVAARIRTAEAVRSE